MPTEDQFPKLNAKINSGPFADLAAGQYRRFEDKDEPLKDMIKASFKGTPTYFKERMLEVGTDPVMNTEFQMLTERMSTMDALMVGAYLNPLARTYIDGFMDEYWDRAGNPGQHKGVPRDVIIGGGLHASIYAAVAHRKTGVKPIVIDNGQRVGGTFAVTSTPTFYLNSRNRPGPLGLPGANDRPGSLNVIPGAPVQPAMLSGEEYADNSSLGWAIRMSLMLHAEVIKGNAVAIEDNIVRLADGQRIDARRVIVATGLGTQRKFGTQGNDRVLSYFDFLRRMESEPFPLRGMDRVAVIGAGDSGKTVIEALTGQGPKMGMTLMHLDFPSKVDWYGCQPTTCGAWENGNRSRYKGIGRNLPRDFGFEQGSGDALFRPARVSPVSRNADDISVGYNEVMVDGKPYDYAVIATGFERRERPLMEMDELPLTNSSIEQVGGMQVGRRFGNGGLPYYLVGPAATLAPTSSEQNAVPGAFNIPENTTAIFRYARKTAALAEAIN